MAGSRIWVWNQDVESWHLLTDLRLSFLTGKGDNNSSILWAQAERSTQCQAPCLQCVRCKQGLGKARLGSIFPTIA